MASDSTTVAQEIPAQGMVTWDSEGSEGGKYHSRKLHVPSEASGLTIGRGSDMKSRTARQVLVDLLRAGVPRAAADALSQGAGLQGARAKQFIRDEALGDFEITPAAQRRLFEIAYEEEAGEARRLATKDDVRRKYGPTNWEKLDPAIREMLVDLKFRGDYTPAARERIQRYVVRNDLAGFAKALADPTLWTKVPTDRFRRRRKFIEGALAQRKAAAQVVPAPPAA